VFKCCLWRRLPLNRFCCVKVLHVEKATTEPVLLCSSVTCGEDYHWTGSAVLKCCMWRRLPLNRFCCVQVLPVEKATTEPWKWDRRLSIFVFPSVSRSFRLTRLTWTLRPWIHPIFAATTPTPTSEGSTGRNWRILPDSRTIWPNPARARSLSTNILLVPHLSPTPFYFSPNEARSIYNLPWPSYFLHVSLSA
jgi:hypothetical protein